MTEAQQKFQRRVSEGKFKLKGVPQSYNFDRKRIKYPEMDSEVWRIESTSERDGAPTRYVVTHLPTQLQIQGASIQWCVDKLEADMSRRHLREVAGFGHALRTDQRDPLHDTTGI